MLIAMKIYRLESYFEELVHSYGDELDLGLQLSAIFTGTSFNVAGCCIICLKQCNKA